jgi:hypothetical protein
MNRILGQGAYSRNWRFASKADDKGETWVPRNHSSLSLFFSQKEMIIMKTRTFLSAALITATVGLGAFNSAMAADATALSAKLSSASEVPANSSAGSGTMEGSLDQKTMLLSWTVTYTGLTGPVKAGHFHGPAPAGANAGVALGFSGSMESPIKGSATLTPAQVAELVAGKWYVNLHTAANPGGEVRGQVSAGQ